MRSRSYDIESFVAHRGIIIYQNLVCCAHVRLNSLAASRQFRINVLSTTFVFAALVGVGDAYPLGPSDGGRRAGEVVVAVCLYEASAVIIRHTRAGVNRCYSHVGDIAAGDLWD